MNFRIQRPAANKSFFAIKVRQHPETKAWEVFTHQGTSNGIWKWYIVEDGVAEWYLKTGAELVEYKQEDILSYRITSALKIKETDSHHLRELRLDLKIAVHNYMHTKASDTKVRALLEQIGTEEKKPADVKEFESTYGDFDDSQIQPLL